MKRHASPQYPKHLLTALALALLTLLAFSNSFDTGFVLDNKGLILNDPRLRDATAANLSLIRNHTYWWPTGEGGVYRPLTTLSYLFNYAILGNRDHPGGYHAINFLIHLANVLLVYALALRFLRRFRPCALIAAVWAIHPVQTEAVTNIVGRADLLAATGVLAGLLAYLRAIEANGRQRWFWLTGVFVFAAVGIFSKENAIVLPAVILLYEFVFRRGRRPRWPVAAGLVAALLPIVFWFSQRSHVLAAALPKEVPVTDNPILGADFWAGRWTAVKVLAHYLWLILWPARLSSDYSWSEIPIARGSVADWLALLIAIAFVPALILLCRRNRGAFFLACVAIAWMAPVANIIFPIGTIMAERFLYIPLLGAAACMVLAIYMLAERARRPAWAPVAICLFITALAARTWARNNDWKDDLSIAEASVQSSPGSYKTHDLLANVLFASDPAHGNLDRVLAESVQTRAILSPLPDDRNVPDPYQLAGTCYLIRGDDSQAIAAFERFLSIETAEFGQFQRTLKPGGPSAESAKHITAVRKGDVYTLLSMAYLRSGDIANAATAAAQARSLNPLSSQLYRQLSEVARAQGDLDKAAELLIEGAFVMSDNSLRQDLVELYRTTMGTDGCALTAGRRGPVIDPRCPAVHRHLCAAEAGTISVLKENGQEDLAATRKKMFEDEFKCTH